MELSISFLNNCGARMIWIRFEDSIYASFGILVFGHVFIQHRKIQQRTCMNRAVRGDLPVIFDSIFVVAAQITVISEVKQRTLCEVSSSRAVR